MAYLAHEVRSLIDLAVTCDVPAREARELGRQLHALNERLGRHRPDRAHPRISPPVSADSPEPWDATAMIDAMPYDVVVGRYNPLAPPLEVSLDPPKAYATARFGAAYEGAPGWVHGAVIAGAFDIVLTAANHLEAASGPTTRLDVRYRRPTLLEEEAQFEAWIDHRRGKRVVSKGVLRQDGEVKVEAEGEFVTIDRSRILRPTSEKNI